MKNVCLDGPWSEAFGLDSFLNCNGHVLMPGHFPVGVGDLVEENSSYRDKVRSKNWLDQRTNDSGIGQFLHLCRYIQQIADSKDAAAFANGAFLVNALYGRKEPSGFIWRQNAFTNRETVVLDFFSKRFDWRHNVILTRSSSLGC